DVGGGQLVADVLVAQHRVVGEAGALFVVGVGVTDHRPGAVAGRGAAVVGRVPRGTRRRRTVDRRIAAAVGGGARVVGAQHRVGVAADHVERADRRRAEVGAERVVAHGELLRVVPQSGDGVAVVVV